MGCGISLHCPSRQIVSLDVRVIEKLGGNFRTIAIGQEKFFSAFTNLLLSQRQLISQYLPDYFDANSGENTLSCWDSCYPGTTNDASSLRERLVIRNSIEG